MSEIPVFQFSLHPDLAEHTELIPTKGEPLATGWDVKAAFLDKKSLTLRAGQYTLIPLGFRCAVPSGYWYELRPRSSSFAKKHLHCLYGVVDETYSNMVYLACMYLPPIDSLCKDLTINFGEAIAQIIPVKRQEMQVQSITNEQYDEFIKNRGFERGGFGSTSK